MQQHSRMQQAGGLLAWLLLTFAVAAVGGLGSSGAGPFYAQLARPGWSPPGWIFGPMWSLLYLLMAVAAWLVWRAGGCNQRRTLALHVAQLAANALWSWLFFRWRLGAVAFAEVIVLWLLIAATIDAFRRTSVAAAWLLVPYLAWVGFATVLTYATWRLNPGLL